MRPSSAFSVYCKLYHIQAELSVWRKIGNVESFRGWNSRGLYGNILFLIYISFQTCNERYPNGVLNSPVHSFSKYQPVRRSDALCPPSATLCAPCPTGPRRGGDPLRRRGLPTADSGFAAGALAEQREEGEAVGGASAVAVGEAAVGVETAGVAGNAVG